MGERTVRERVHEIQRECRETDVSPSRCAELLLTLTALLGNISDEVREADFAYALVLLKHYQATGVVSGAKLHAEITPEYQRKREAADVNRLAIELVRSLKDVLKLKTTEMRLT